MKASYNSQYCNSEKRYSIQFETDNPEIFRGVESVCHEMVDFCHIYNDCPELARIYGYRWDKPETKE